LPLTERRGGHLRQVEAAAAACASRGAGGRKIRRKTLKLLISRKENEPETAPFPAVLASIFGDQARFFPSGALRAQKPERFSQAQT